MKKSKTLVSLLALGVLASSALVGCNGNNNNGNNPSGGGNTEGGGEVQEPTDQEIADVVIAAINALTDNSSEADITAVRTSYNALTAAQKALVTNLAKLTKQENRLADDKLVKVVVDAIGVLTDTSTKEEVDAAWAKYLELDESLRSKVTNLNILLIQRARIDASETVAPVIEAINSLTNESTLEEVQAVEAIYNGLSEIEQGYIAQEIKDKLDAQINRVYGAIIDNAKAFIDGVVVEDLVSDVAVIKVLKEYNEIEFTEAIMNAFSDAQKAKLGLLRQTLNSYTYAGENQARTWTEAAWGADKYGTLDFKEEVFEEELNGKVRPFDVTYYDSPAYGLMHEFGVTLVGDSNLTGNKQAVVYVYNPDVDTNVRIDYNKDVEGTFCDGDKLLLQHGWNRLSINLLDVIKGVNVVNLMIGEFEGFGAITETTGWKMSSFIIYDELVEGAIRTEYYRIRKLMVEYYENSDPTERNEYNKIVSEYSKLTNNEKEMLPHASEIKEKIESDNISFKEADANALNTLLGAIPQITAETNLHEYALNYFIKLNEYKSQYDKFDEYQKALVTNANILTDGLAKLVNYELVSDGTMTFTSWNDYETGAGDTTTTTDLEYGTVQAVTTENSEQHALLFPMIDGFENYDEFIFPVYIPDGTIQVVSSGNWPYNLGTLTTGWNVISVSTELCLTYPNDTFGIFMYGTGEFKFGKAIGFTNVDCAEALVNTINSLTYTEKSLVEEQAIVDARATYNTLGLASKNLVTNISKLDELEKAIEDYYVGSVITAIDELEFDVEGDSQETQKAAIEAARAMYENLTDARKEKITNLTKLEELETTVRNYYHDACVAELEDTANELVEITTSTSFDVALSNYAQASKIKADEFYDDVGQEFKDKIEATIEAFENIYTKLSDRLTAIGDSKPEITKKVDSQFGEVLSVKGSDGGVQVTYSEAGFSSFDYLYLIVKTEADFPDGFNVWGPKWHGDVQTIKPFNAGEWTVIKLNTEIFDPANCNLNQLDFCLLSVVDNHEILMTGIYGAVEVETPRVITFGEGGITLQSENMAGNDWPSCTKTEIQDENVGVAYQYSATEFNNDIKNNTLYWVLNKEQLDAVLDADGSEMDIFVPDNGKTYRFGVQDTTGWSQVEKPLINGVWNHVVVDKDFVKTLNFASSGNVAYFRILSDDPSNFYSDEFKLTPMYKHERVLTTIHFGEVVDTKETLENFGTIYSLTRGSWFVENSVLDTFGNFNKDTLRDKLPNGTSRLCFKIYNPLDEDVTFFTAGGEPWADGNNFTLASKEWTTIILDEKDISLTDSGTMYIYARKSGGVGAADAEGWQITDIWAI